MGWFNHARALRAAMVACLVACFGPVTAVHAAAPEFTGALGAASESAEPFHLWTSRVFWGGLAAKWQSVAHKLDDERVQLALCDGDRENCASDAALRLLAIVDSGRQREGRARLGEINRAINLAIRPMSDLAQFGQEDFWSSPLVTFYRGAGDCEDYAIAKYVSLRRLGVPAGRLRIAVVQDQDRDTPHAVLLADVGGTWYVLDNLSERVEPQERVGHYVPYYSLNEDGFWAHALPPDLMARQERAAAAVPTGPRD